jgi:hypothetical protein
MRYLFLLLLAATLYAQSPPLMLGALEDTHGAFADDQYTRSVRALFIKSGNDWKPLPTDCLSETCLTQLSKDYPRETVWTIAFDGRKLGDVTSRIPAVIKTYSNAGQQQIVTALPKGRVPTIGARTKEFAGFIDDPVFRPLVAISQPNFKDPDLWKPAQLPAAQLKLLRDSFRAKFPGVENCKTSTSEPAPWAYTDADIELQKAYSAKSGWTIAQLHLGKSLCEGPPDGPFNGQWFAIDPAGAIAFLQANMVLIDAGDYDNSGHSQLLFLIDDYNRGGYVLYYNNFQSSAVFEYTFH